MTVDSPVSARALAPPIYAGSLLAALGKGTMLLLIPIQGLELGGLMGGFSLPGMFAVGAVLTNLPGAMAVTRFGHKPVMLFGMALMAVSALVVAYAGSLWLMTAAAFTYGLGQGANGLARVAYLADMVQPEQRGRVVSAVGGSHRIGLFAGPAAGGALAALVDRPTAIAAVALCCGLAFLVLALRLPPGTTVPSPVQSTPLSMVGRVLSRHRHTFATAGIAMLALSLVRHARMLLIPICGTMLGLGEAEVGVVKSLSMGVDMVLFYPAGIAMDRLGRKWTAAPCLVVLSIGVVLVGMADSYGALLVGGLVAGLGNGIGSGINMTLAGDYSPREGRAEFIGVWGLTSDLGSAVSPFVMGSVASAMTLAGAASVATGIGLAGAALVVVAMRETLVKPEKSLGYGE
ncbi:MAG: MFS transporter [Myxococcales bacterium]|nr:MFS transporter [Myxococcales bacterium]